LILYARQLAWFDATPVKAGADKPKAVAGATPVEKHLTRAQAIRANGGTPLMPHVDEAMYLVQYWQDMGVATEGGFAPTALTAQEVESWQRCTGIDLQPWEFSAVRAMSRAYLRQAHESEQPECPPPYGDPVNQFDRNVVAKKVSNAFKAFIQAGRK
jgi:hypothetical protein